MKKFKEYLEYMPDIGEFKWIKCSRRNNSLVNKIAGNIDLQGYKRIGLFRKTYKVHRLVWLFENGEWPKYQIDHIDGNKLNNVITNLRDVKHRENVSNHQCHRNGKLVGVTFCKKSGKYRARITINKKEMYIGRFKTKELAHKAYINKKNTVVDIK